MLRIKNKHITSASVRKVIFDRNLLNNKKIIKEIHKISVDDTVAAEEAVEQFNLKTNARLKQLKVVREVKVIDREDFISTRIKRLIHIKNDTARLARNQMVPIERYKEAKSLVKKEIIKFRRRRYLNYIKKGINFLKHNDCRNSWRWLKSHAKICKKSSILNAVLDKTTKELVSDPVPKMQVWANHFASLCQGTGIDHLINIPKQILDIKMITDGLITWDEIKIELKSTRNHKAAGDDGIPSEFYKVSLLKEDSEFSKSILKIFNLVFNGGLGPKQWENCTIVPIFKKGDDHDTNNYRGIALINTLQKLLAKIMARRLQTVCTQFSFLKREQAGFMSSGECLGQVTTLLECCQRRKFKNENTILCFLDLKKAYDMVPHQKLINKLIKKQLGDKFVGFIKSMYSNTKMKVRIGDLKSDSFEYKRGVRQGCPTSPLLFNIYIDDLLDSMDPIRVEGLLEGFRGLMFADDTVIAANDFNDLEHKLALVEQWMVDNGMEVNPSKCGVMIIKANDDIDIHKVQYRGEEIPLVDSYVYLGVDFNNELDLQRMSQFRAQKGVERSRALTPTLRNYRVPLEYKRMLINSIIIPTLSYGTEIFGMSERRTQNLKRIVDINLSQILNTKNYCRNRAYEEFDLKSVHVRAAISRTRALCKWRDTGFLIKDLIESSSQFKSRKSTWTKGTSLWLKRFKIYINNPDIPGKQLVLDNYSLRIDKKDKTVATKLGKEYRLKSGKRIRRLEINKTLKPLGVYQLLRIRTGTFSYTNNLVYKGIIGPEYKNKCFWCGSSRAEDLEHLLFYCTKFNQERSTHLHSTVPNTGTSANLKNVTKTVLGGDCPASGKMPAETVVRTIDYLSAVSLRRSAILTDLQKRTL